MRSTRRIFHACVQEYTCTFVAYDACAAADDPFAARTCSMDQRMHGELSTRSQREMIALNSHRNRHVLGGSGGQLLLVLCGALRCAHIPRFESFDFLYDARDKRPYVQASSYAGLQRECSNKVHSEANKSAQGGSSNDGHLTKELISSSSSSRNDVHRSWRARHTYMYFLNLHLLSIIRFTQMSVRMALGALELVRFTYVTQQQQQHEQHEHRT
uniref:Uncharacterized protein n=1 Tax=Trichogramma kaykai TaxID=54128 RepID=A0ABD2WM78_9HYME